MLLHRAVVWCLALAAIAPAAAAAQTEQRVIYASVVNKNGDFVPNLTEKDFVVREDGQAREILSVAPDDDPLHIALLVDTSDEMRDRVAELRRAVVAFIGATRPGAQIALITTGERPTIAVPYTLDRTKLKEAAQRLFPVAGSGNYLLDGIAESSKGVSTGSSTRTVIAAISGVPDLSYRKYQEVLDALTDSGASLHVLTLGMAPGDFDRETVVSRGTESTGGRNEMALSAQGLEPKATQMAAEISHQYRVTFARPQRLIPPKNTEISVKNPDLRARGMLVKTERER